MPLLSRGCHRAPSAIAPAVTVLTAGAANIPGPVTNNTASDVSCARPDRVPLPGDGAPCWLLAADSCWVRGIYCLILDAYCDRSGKVPQR